MARCVFVRVLASLQCIPRAPPGRQVFVKWIGRSFRSDFQIGGKPLNMKQCERRVYENVEVLLL